ncbi:glutamate ligase domain-containing protein, partial [Escherichia coli]|uniref:glutamate ligase domain-containing protein n=2 Tax=Bacteria TaxID=2 RepID=UPI00289DFA17
HNPHGAKALATAMGRDFSFRRLIGVVGMLGDKDARGVLENLEPVLDEVVITQSSSPRALDADVLADYARDAFGEERVHVAYNLP